MFIRNLILLFILIKSSYLTTLTKTYPTIDLKENIPKHTNVFQLTREVKNLKLVLLNLGGFESNLFTIKDENIFTINEIDREKLLGEKRCFDRSYCLIELHILVNDGEEYWVIPIHIIDENDNKPEFKNSSIELKFHENIFGGYKILFEGAKDLDEGLNGKIRYILDCSSNNSKRKSKNLILKENKNDSLINCFPLFEFEIISQSLINQYDQLALKFIPPKSNEIIEHEYNLILYAIDYGLDHNALFSFMNINIKIEKILRKPKFLLNEYEFIIKVNSSLMKKGTILGNVNAESNDKRKRILYRIINKTISSIEINSLTGQLFISNDDIINDEIHLLIEASYLLNENEDFKSFAKVKIFIRSINYLNNISFHIRIQSLFIQQLSDPATFSIKKNTSINENLFQLTISSSYYPSDKYILLLDNYYSTFSIISSSQLTNNFILKLSNYLISNSIYLLNFRVKHQLTKEILSTNFTVQLIVSDQLATIPTTSASSSSLSLTLTSNLTSKASLSSICNENITYFLFDFYNKNPIGKLKVIQTNINISYFSNFFLLINQNEFVINQCRMLIDRFDDFNFNETQYELCSIDFVCYNISSMNEQNSFLFIENNAKKRFGGSSILFLRPIEITILTLSIVFILATISLILIICRLKGFHLCLTIKNYLFYGKKYGLNNAQRLSTTKMKQRVHSIVVRESRSPSFEPIKANKSYMFNINQIAQQEPMPPIPLYSQSSPRQPISLSCTSSIQQDERIISNFDNETTPRTSSSSSSAAAAAFIQEANQLLDILSSNHDSHLSTLASDV